MKNFEFSVDKKGRCNFKDIIIIVKNLQEKIDMLEIRNKNLKELNEELSRRLQHLFESEFIRSFDEKYFSTDEYKRDIKEADEIAIQKNLEFHYEHSGTPILTGDDAKAFTKAFVDYLERRYL